MKKLAIALVIGISLLLIQSVALAQKSETPTSGPTVSEQDIELLRSDIRSTKKQIIAANMKLTDSQAEKFWPVYDEYAQETTKLGDGRYALIKEYANHYEDMTDAQAESLVTKWQRWTSKLRPCARSGFRNSRRCLLENRMRCFFNWTGASICCSICSLPPTFRLSSSVQQP